MVLRLHSKDATFSQDFSALLHASRDAQDDVRAVVLDILADVRRRGDTALREYTKRFDRIDMTASTMKVTTSEIETAWQQCQQETLDALYVAAKRIEDFHHRHLPTDDSLTDKEGVALGVRWTAVEAAGLYVPGGKASYPSSVLMNAIPAKVAGVERIVMVVPAPDGVLNPLVLAAAKLAGVTEIYKIGGAQAVAALAYGTETIQPVDIITGPGNAFVAEAKREVFGTVGIDMVAGPSEILVVADNKNDPQWIAIDLLSQAEHDEVAQSILITDDADYATMVEAAVENQLSTLPRASIARKSWEDHGVVIVVDDLRNAPPLINKLAPEHLELAVDSPDTILADTRNAGSIFLGRHTPEAIGDYVAGPNHVLPTARSARFSSGLSVLNFMKRSTLIQCSAASLERIGPAAITLAEAEGLHAHARSIDIRLTDR